MTHSAKRTAALRELLQTRQQEIRRDLEHRLTRTRENRPEQGGDQLEHSDNDAQAGLGYALLQMKTEQLVRVEEALRRVDMGRYGSCLECGREIAAKRLRALPFAVRCQACQGTREALASSRRASGAPSTGLSLFTDTAGV